MKIVLKVFGKIVAILLAFVLFFSELSFIVVEPLVFSLKNVKEVVTQIDIKEFVSPRGDEQQYQVFVDNVSSLIGVEPQQGKKLIETQAVKEGVGEVLQSVVEVMGGDESKKLTKQDLSNIISETIQKAEKEANETVPEDIMETINEALAQFSIDEIYEKINAFINGTQPTGAVNPNNKVLSINNPTFRYDEEIDITRLLGFFVGNAASGAIIGVLIGAIIVIVALIFLCQFSIVGGLIETGIVSVLAGIPLLFVNSVKENLLNVLGGEGSRFVKIVEAIRFDKFTTDSIIFIVIGIAMIIAGIIISTTKKNKKKVVNNNEAIEIIKINPEKKIEQQEEQEK